MNILAPIATRPLYASRERFLVNAARWSTQILRSNLSPAAETCRRVLRGDRDAFASGSSASPGEITKASGEKAYSGHWIASWKKRRDNGIVTVEGDVAQLTELFTTKEGGRDG